MARWRKKRPLSDDELLVLLRETDIDTGVDVWNGDRELREKYLALLAYMARLSRWKEAWDEETRDGL